MTCKNMAISHVYIVQYYVQMDEDDYRLKYDD